HDRPTRPCSRPPFRAGSAKPFRRLPWSAPRDVLALRSAPDRSAHPPASGILQTADGSDAHSPRETPPPCQRQPNRAASTAAPPSLSITPPGCCSSITSFVTALARALVTQAAHVKSSPPSLSKPRPSAVQAGFAPR